MPVYFSFDDVISVFQNTNDYHCFIFVIPLAYGLFFLAASCVKEKKKTEK